MATRLRRAIASHRDIALAAALAVLFGIEIATESDFAGDRAVSIAAGLVFAATLALRRRAPLLPLAVSLGVIELSNLAAPALGNTATFLLALIVAVYTAGRHTHGRAAIAGGGMVLAAIPLAAIEPGQTFHITDLPFFLVFLAVPWILGAVIRHRSERERGLVRERDTKAREAVVEERARIARELHDVVAHAISVMVLQARGGRRMLDEDPAETREALNAIEHAGEQALAEMRRLLGMLRQTDDALALAPQPSLARIDELVGRLAATGLPVEVTVEGEPMALPPGIDVSAYRIVQEALTNTLKHAGPARAHVILRYRPDDLELEILDDGSGTGNGSPMRRSRASWS
jgi:signal transduction histidine kinase